MSISDKIFFLNETFKTLCAGLYGLNFCSNIQIYSVSGKAGDTIENIVAQATGNPVKIEMASKIDASQIIEELREALCYRGTEGSHPDLDFLDSQKFTDLSKEVYLTASEVLGQANKIIAFRLTEGHPFYPVFWEFAFVLEINENAFVWIGSSSD